MGKEVFYEDLEGLLEERGLPAFVERLDQLVGERSAAIIVVDSFKALHAFARDPSDSGGSSTTSPPVVRLRGLVVLGG